MGVAGLGNISRLTTGTARKWTRQSGKIAASLDRNRDSVELGEKNIQTASKEEYTEERYIEVNGRRFSVSDEIAALHERVKALNQMRVMMEAAEQSAEAARQQTKVLAEQAKAQAKALEIYRRIATGGRVPPEDEDFLRNFSPEMYLAAKMAALMAEEHKDYDSVLEDEEEKPENAGESTEETTSDGDTAAANTVSVEMSAE